MELPSILAAESDERLMARICDDDRQAIAELFCRYARRLRGLAFKSLHDMSEADDLVQEVFLLVHRDCRKFDPRKGSVRFWLFQLTYSRAINRWRSLKSRHFYTQVEISDLADTLPAPTLQMETIASRDMLVKMFEALSIDQHETLRLYFFEGYTLPEIAAQRGKQVAAVKNHYFRGLDRLRRQLHGQKLCAPRQTIDSASAGYEQKARPAKDTEGDEIGTKVCFKCSQEKPLSAFYRHPLTVDRHLGKCKECVKAYGREYRLLGAALLEER
jgi:RNA polymerase sigma-70 factor, ECF subfamily